MGIIKAALSGDTTPGVRMGANYIGAPSFRVQNPYGFFDFCENDTYASVYPSVKAIANAFKVIRPFAVDKNGKPQEQVPVINALYRPNQKDSSVAFREKLVISKLVHRNTYLLVWRKDGKKVYPGGEITAANIGGFTFLERPSITRIDNMTYYNIGSQQFSEDEVITIPGGVDPNNLYGGYSAGVASMSWARLDDYIADFQRGFFENGAVPAGQFIITAPTVEDFNNTVDKLQAKHQGAGKNNNVTYVHRPVDENSQPLNAQVEWIPFQQTNKDIDFKNLFEQANNRIDSTYGVPASIRGVGENNNFATAKTDQQNFVRFTVDPIAMDIYTQITHELNRITGGLGVSITYELEIPAIADEEKVEAETKQLEVTAILQLTDKGFSLDSIVDALNLSTAYKTLELGGVNTKINNDKPEVDEGDEVVDSPDPSKIDGVTPLNKGEAKRKNPKANNAATDYDKLFSAARKTMKRQVDKAVDEVSEADISNEVHPDPTLDEQNVFIDEMMAVIAGILADSGSDQYKDGKKLMSDFGIDNLPEEYTLPEAADDRYRSYLKKVAASYMTDTADTIRKVLADANTNGLSLADTKKQLRSIMETDEYRIRRMAETELNRSQAIGSIESMRDIQDRTGVRLQKGLAHGGGDSPCEFCASLLTQWVDVDQDLIPLGETVIGVDGGMYINNFAANEGYDIHPNGHCYPQYRVVAS